MRITSAWCRPARSALLVLMATLPMAATAAAPTETLNRYACSGCHGMSQKIVGPGFNEIAARYKTQKDAASHLATRIRSGGSGLWGPVPMPPQAAITDAEIATVVSWLLSGANP